MQSLDAFAQLYAKETHGDLTNLTFCGGEFDSRRIVAGQIFFAFLGEHVDGHDFLQQARNNGAVAAVVSRACAVDIPQLVVGDVQSCFIDSASRIRSTWQQKTVIAITGSMGKTSSKDLLANVCGAHQETFSTPGNYNNLLGLSWCIHNTPMSARYVILELGISEVGEMQRLAALAQPDIAWVTTIAPCHLDGLTSCEIIAREKSQIYRSLGSNGLAVINDRDDFVETFLQHSQHCRQLHLYAGMSSLDDASIRYDALARCRFSAQIGDESLSLQLGLVGKHQVYNAYAVGVIAHAMGIPMTLIKDGLETQKTTSGRAKAYVLPMVKSLLIDDSYNANPKAMLSAIESLSSVDKPVKCLVFGDMSELGSVSDKWHRRVGDWASEYGIDHLLTYGVHAQLALQSFCGDGMAFSDQDAMIDHLRVIMSEDMVVLVKGSRGCSLDLTIRSLLGTAMNEG